MIKSYLETINETLDSLMTADEQVVLIGEDIGEYGGCFGVTKGLYEKYGDSRVIDTPMSEQSIVGVSIGAAMNGLRPIAEIMFMDFVTLIFDQLMNHAGIFSYLSNGEISVPVVIRVPAGGGRGYGATHSKTMTASLMQIPGIKIVAPASPSDAGPLLEEALMDNNPVIYIEHKLLYGVKEEIPDKQKVPIGKAKVLREGKDIVLISYSKTVFDCLEAAKKLEEEGIQSTVIDLRTIKPLDKETIKEAIDKVGKVVVVEEGFGNCGLAAEIITEINETCFYSLTAAPRRVTSYDIPIACAFSYESAELPSVERILQAVKEVMHE